MHAKLSLLLLGAGTFGVAACGGPEPAVPPPATSSNTPVATVAPPPMSTDAAAPPAAAGPATFADDVAFLTKFGAVHVLEAPGGGRVAVSSLYQGRVMTSAVEGAGKSFGWINRDFVASGKNGTQFDNYGGEERFWLGPEGGQFGLYFPPGKAFTFDVWQVPAGMQEGAWEMTEATPARAVFKHVIQVTNWSGTPFVIEVERTVSLVEAPPVEGVRAV